LQGDARRVRRNERCRGGQRGSNDLGPHDRRYRPLFALAIRISDTADQLETERPGWSWPGYAFVLGWLNLIAGHRVEDVDIVAVALGHFDRQAH
jgi:hypothetical protein